ncbi:antitoxin HicB [Leptotrichia hongkongensis]|uniref:Antitoxin HicB n=1 Tax=Leptotrichia hongkongensis TaxID=554406 RepID=A0ABV4S7H5_9FUSO
MLKRDVMYPAIVTKEDEVYYVGLVDFDRLEDGNINYYATYSEDLEKVSAAIRESLALYLADLLDMKKEFPEPSKLEDIKLKKNQFIQVISVDPVYEAAKVTNVLKKKTVNIPAWLDIVAQEKKINFSQLLQKALKKELGIE